MVVQSNELDEIVITYKDPMSREQKTRMFKIGFLGTVDDEKCRIENENDLILRYSSEKEVLTVSSNNPIVVINRYLGYKLEYSLIHFSAEYKKYSSRLLSYYGTTQFSSLSERNKYKRRRRQAYLGSVLHFMRTVYDNTLPSNKFGFVENRMIAFPEKIIDRSIVNETVHVSTVSDVVKVVYYKKNPNRYSGMVIESKEFVIDKFGNYASTPRIVFSGDMAAQKTCHMLPLDYSLERDYLLLTICIICRVPNKYHAKINYLGSIQSKLTDINDDSDKIIRRIQIDLPTKCR